MFDLLVRSGRVDAASVNARPQLALVHVGGARGARVAGRARAAERIDERGALPVLARTECAVVDELAALAAEAARAGARVVVERAQVAGAGVEARRRVARVRHRDLAQRRREAERARAREARHRVRRHLHRARPAILAARARSGVAWVRKLAVLAHVLRRATASTKSNITLCHYHFN